MLKEFRNFRRAVARLLAPIVKWSGRLFGGFAFVGLLINYLITFGITNIVDALSNHYVALLLAIFFLPMFFDRVLSGTFVFLTAIFFVYWDATDRNALRIATNESENMVFVFTPLIVFLVVITESIAYVLERFGEGYDYD